MVEFRARVTVSYRAISIEHALQIIESYLWSTDREPGDDYVGEGVVEFKHPTLGWMPIDTSDRDEDLDGEAYLRQG